MMQSMHEWKSELLNRFCWHQLSRTVAPFIGKNVNLWAVYLCFYAFNLETCSTSMWSDVKFSEANKRQTNNGEIDWNAQRDGVFLRLLVVSLLEINILLCRIRCLLFMVHEKSGSKNKIRFEWEKEESIINVFIHEKMSLLGSRTWRGFFYGFTDSGTWRRKISIKMLILWNFTSKLKAHEWEVSMKKELFLRKF